MSAARTISLLLGGTVILLLQAVLGATPTPFPLPRPFPFIAVGEDVADQLELAIKRTSAQIVIRRMSKSDALGSLKTLRARKEPHGMVFGLRDTSDVTLITDGPTNVALIAGRFVMHVVAPRYRKTDKGKEQITTILNWLAAPADVLTAFGRSETDTVRVLCALGKKDTCRGEGFCKSRRDDDSIYAAIADHVRTPPSSPQDKIPIALITRLEPFADDRIGAVLDRVDAVLLDVPRSIIKDMEKRKCIFGEPPYAAVIISRGTYQAMGTDVPTLADAVVVGVSGLGQGQIQAFDAIIGRPLESALWTDSEPLNPKGSAKPFAAQVEAMLALAKGRLVPSVGLSRFLETQRK